MRGHVYTTETPRANPSYQCLLEENARLSTLVSSFNSVKSFDQDSQREFGDDVEQFETRLFTTVAKSQQARTVSQHAQIAWPSKECSGYVLNHAALWTDWMHFAAFAPHIRQEHELFWSRLSISSSLEDEDPLWLAVYFSILSSALLFMNEAEFQQCAPSLHSRTALLRNWYDSALYFLDVGDFLGRCDVAVVRVAAILGLVAVNLGDSVRHENLWACAIRIGQQLNLGWDQLNSGETPIEQETRRRLWWELVLREWLSSPARLPCIANVDFHCALPVDIDDLQLLGCADAAKAASEQSPRPIQYHIAMAKISITFNNVRSRLHTRRWSGSEIAVMVIESDNELATVIDGLPPHLQNDERRTDSTLERDALFPGFLGKGLV